MSNGRNVIHSEMKVHKFEMNPDSGEATFGDRSANKEMTTTHLLLQEFKSKTKSKESSRNGKRMLVKENNATPKYVECKYKL